MLGLLLMGQAFKLVSLTSWTIASQHIAFVLGECAVIFLEAALPLGALVASGLVFSRLKRDGAHIALSGVGIPPAQLVMPLIPATLLVTLATMWLSSTPVPNAVSMLGKRLEGLVVESATRSKGTIDLGTASILTDQTSTNDWQHWILVAQDDGKPDQLVYGSNLKIHRSLHDWRMTLSDAWIWINQVRVRTKHMEWSVPRPKVKALGMLGPPNATTNPMLSTSDPHHVFTLHRRFALSCMALLWGLIGAFLGLRMNGPIVVILSSGLVASSYWILRTGELAARAGELSLFSQLGVLPS